MVESDTLPKLLLRNSKQYGTKKVAMRRKDFGIWAEYSWNDYYQNVKWLCLGMTSLELQRGDKVAIIGDNNPEWYWAELAAQSCGCAAVGIYPDSIVSEVKYLLEHSEATFVVAEDQEQIDKILEIKDKLPRLKRVIYWDPKGLRHYAEPVLISLSEVIDLGKKYEQEWPGLFAQNVEQTKADDTAVLCYTSGTTAAPKGAMLTHKYLIDRCESVFTVDPWNENYDYLSFLSPAWIADQITGITSTLLTGATVNFPEEPETVQKNFREIAPHLVSYSSSQWESLVSQTQIKMGEADHIKRFFYNVFLPVGLKIVSLKNEKRGVTLFWRALYKVADLIVFRQLRDYLGFSRLKYAIGGGTMLSPEIYRYFRGIGVNLKNAYGLTEAILSTMQTNDDLDLETCGRPIPGVEARAEEGEILIRGKLFAGYYRDPQATQDKLRGGWFHTGDAGHITEDGKLVFIDRLKDLVPLAEGTKFSPQFIESCLKFTPYIREAASFGGKDKPYVSIIVNIDFDSVGKWAEKKGIPYTTMVDLSQKPQVAELVRNSIDSVNKLLPEPSWVRKYVVLHKDFDPDEAELTRTRKIKRNLVEERYAELLKAIYKDQTQLTVKANVTYRDGRKGTVTTALEIRSVQ
jgi:long-chain acyl-CoA synthetase